MAYSVTASSVEPGLLLFQRVALLSPLFHRDLVMYINFRWVLVVLSVGQFRSPLA